MEALLLLALLTGSGLLAVIVIAEHRARTKAWATREMTFARQTDTSAVTSFLGLLASLPHSACLALEVRADSSGVRHFIQTDQATLDTVEGQLRAVLPGVRLTEAASDRPSLSVGRRLVLHPADGILRQDDVETSSAALLAGLHPLSGGEVVVLRWLLTPTPPIPLAEPSDERRKRGPDYDSLARVKHGGRLLRVGGLLGAQAGHPQRAEHLLGRVGATVRARGGVHGRLRLRPVGESRLRRGLARQWVGGQMVLSPAELVGVLGWPLGSAPVSGVVRGTSPVRLPSGRIPSTGRVLGRSTWPGLDRLVAQPAIGALSHTLIAGPTGVGKSALMTNLIVQDLHDGRGVLVLDGKGDLVHDVLARVPLHRTDDVVVLDCAWNGPVPGLRLFGGGQPDLEADVALGVLADLFRDSWGPLSERYLRAGLQAVAHDPGSTLADVPFVFSDARYRRRLVGRIEDPLTAGVFAAFEAMSTAEQAHVLAAPLNKLTALLGRSTVRAIVGQPKPTLDFTRVVRDGKIVVVSLAPTRIGTQAARLVAALTVVQVFGAIQARASQPVSSRRPFFIYLDEPKALGDLPMPVDALLEQARGLGAGVVIAPQSVSQLGAPLRAAVLTNAATRIVFRQNSDDARLLARDLGGVTPDDLGDLAQFEAVARIGLGPGDIAAPVTIKTLPKPPVVQSAEGVRAAAGKRYGVDPRAVTEALLARHRHDRDATSDPVGRTRRAS